MRGDDCIALVAMEGDRRRTGIRRVLLDAEDAGALGMEQSFVDEFLRRAATGEVGVQRQPGVRPLRTGFELSLEEVPDSLVSRLDERSREAAVVANQLLT